MKEEEKKPKKKRLRPVMYQDNTFHYRVFFFIGWTRDEFNKYCTKHFNSKQDVDESYAGIHVELGGKSGDTASAIWVEDASDVEIIAHECLHATVCMLNERGIDIRNDNGEVGAYIMGRLIKEALDK